MVAAPEKSPRINNHAGLIWAIADLLRGDYKQSEYGRVILPLVVLRRLDCVLEPTKERVLKKLASLSLPTSAPSSGPSPEATSTTPRR